MHFLRSGPPDIGLENWLSLYVGFVPTPLLNIPPQLVAI